MLWQKQDAGGQADPGRGGTGEAERHQRVEPVGGRGDRDAAVGGVRIARLGLVDHDHVLSRPQASEAVALGGGGHRVDDVAAGAGPDAEGMQADLHPQPAETTCQVPPPGPLSPWPLVAPISGVARVEVERVVVEHDLVEVGLGAAQDADLARHAGGDRHLRRRGADQDGREGLQAGPVDALQVGHALAAQLIQTVCAAAVHDDAGALARDGALGDAQRAERPRRPRWRRKDGEGGGGEGADGEGADAADPFS